MLLASFYVAEVLRHVKEGWVQHAMGTGLVAAVLLTWIVLVREAVKRLSGGTLPSGVKWTERLFAALCIVLIVFGPLLHGVPRVAWMGIMVLPLTLFGALYIEVQSSLLESQANSSQGVEKS